MSMSASAASAFRALSRCRRAATRAEHSRRCCPIAIGVASRRSHNTRASASGDGQVRQLFLDKAGQINPTVGAAALVLGGALSARFVYGQLLGGSDGSGNNNHHGGPRRDASRVTVKISTAPYDRAKASSAGAALTPQKLADGSKHANVVIDEQSVELKSVDAAAFAAFVSRQQRELQDARERSQSRSARVLHDELADALSDVEGRIGSFADWYFAYSTQYSLLGIAMTSAAKHAVTFRTEQSLSEAVTEDIQAHIGRKYEALVLRPAITDPKVQRAFVKSLKAAHADYMKAVGSLDRSIAAFIEGEATAYANPPRLDQVDVDIDWTTQLQKVRHIPLAFERRPEMSVAIVGASAAAGKAAGGAATVAAVKALSAKLAAPFATKAAASTLAKAATAGAAGGAALAGPAGSMAGAAAGAAIGLGIDITVNAGVALVSKPAFEKDVRESLWAMRLEWEERLLPELERCQKIWFGHAEELLRQSTSSAESATHPIGTECDGSEDRTRIEEGKNPQK